MFQPRPHQTAATEAVQQAFRNSVKRPLVDMCVAAGKSITYGMVASRAVGQGAKVLIGAHTRELVKQNAAACRLVMPDQHIGINAAALDERTWRAPVISAAIQSVWRHAERFGPIDLLICDECHLLAHSETGMYRELWKALGEPLLLGGSGTPFRLKGGSLIEGENAPFERLVYVYSILNGIRDGYLVPPISLAAEDVLDPAGLKIGVDGDYTPGSQDKQMIDLIDSHIMQIISHGQDRRSWLIFEASTTAAVAMRDRMHQFGIPTGLVLGKTPDQERENAIRDFQQGRLRALVNLNALTTGFDVPETDLLVMRRRTTSLGLYIQMIGRVLRTIGGNIQASIAAGKADGAVLDFAGNIDQHGALDNLIRPTPGKASFCTCDHCGAKNPAAARWCRVCDEALTKNCPACLTPIMRGVVECPHCGFDMHLEPGERKEVLLDRPSGAPLLSKHKGGIRRQGGWIPVRAAWENNGVHVLDDVDGGRWSMPAPLAPHAAAARWIRPDPLSILVPNGAIRSSIQQVFGDGRMLIVPMPAPEV